MTLRRDVGLLYLLVLTGCGSDTPPAPTSTGKPAPPAANAASGTNDVGNMATPVARLLGKPVTRGDCLSHSSGIDSAEVGIQRLVLGVLMHELCKGEHLELTQNEIDAFWQTLQSLQPEQDPPREPPSFDQLQIPAKLAETRAKLAAPNVGWLERLALEGMERGQLFALEHQSVPAAVAYSELMPLKCVNAVYRKYGGKVVARQISMEPAEALLKLAREAEQQGKLEFLDGGLKQAFWKRMNDDLQHPAVAPESIDFSLPAIYQRPAAGTTVAAKFRFEGFWGR